MNGGNILEFQNNADKLFSLIIKYIPIAGILFCILLFIFSTFFSYNLYLILCSILELLIFIIYLLIKSNQTEEKIIPFKTSRSIFFLTEIIFYVLLIALVFIFATRDQLYSRPILFFIVSSLMSVVIFIDIFIKPNDIKNTIKIIIKICILSLLLLLSQSLLFPTVIGIDPFWHQGFTNDLLSQSHVPEGFGQYSKLPLFHIQNAITILITNLNYKYATLFSMGFIQVILIIMLIFLISKFFFSDKIALLACLFVAIGQYHIFSALWTVPCYYAFSFVFLILLVLQMNKNNNLKFFLLLILFFTVVVLSHLLTTLIAIILLTCAFTINYVNKKFFSKQFRMNISGLTLAFFLIFTLFYWIYLANLMGLNALIRGVMNGGEFMEFGVSPIINTYQAAYIQQISSFELIYNHLGEIIFILFSTLGSVFLLSKRPLNLNWIYYVIIANIPLIFFISSIFFKFAIQNERWLVFAQIILSVSLAVSLILLMNYIKIPSFSIFFGSLFVGTICFLMITSAACNFDNNFLNPNIGSRMAFTESEVSASRTISSYSTDSLYVDGFYSTLFPSHIDFTDKLISGNFEQTDKKIIVIRKYVLSHPVFIGIGSIKINYNVEQRIQNIQINKIYSNFEVNGYQ